MSAESKDQNLKLIFNMSGNYYFYYFELLKKCQIFKSACNVSMNLNIPLKWSIVKMVSLYQIKGFFFLIVLTRECEIKKETCVTLLCKPTQMCVMLGFSGAYSK